MGTGVLIEQPGSPRWTFGESTKATQVFRGQYALARVSAPPRGSLGLGDFNGMKVSESSVEIERGGIGVLTVTYEGVPQDDDDEEFNLPPDEVDIDFAQQEIDARKLPRYAALTAEDLWAIDAWLNSADFNTQEFLDWMDSGENAALIAELRENLARGETHKLIWPPIVRWTSYSINEPVADGGGYIGDPFAPISFPPGYQWLRYGDQKSFTGSYWKLTRTWQAAESWSTDYYP